VEQRDRAQVHVQVEAEAHAQEDVLGMGHVGHTRIPERAEIDRLRVDLAEACDNRVAGWDSL
jgi:hypothetical protein